MSGQSCPVLPDQEPTAPRNKNVCSKYYIMSASVITLGVPLTRLPARSTPPPHPYESWEDVPLDVRQKLTVADAKAANLIVVDDGHGGSQWNGTRKQHETELISPGPVPSPWRISNR